MSLTTEVLLGVYLGLLAGIIPAFIAGFLGFLFRYATGVSIPAFAVIVLAAAVAGVNGGLMGLLDESVARAPRFIVAILIVMMLAIYAHSQGDKLGAELPRRFSLRSIRRQTLSADVIRVVGGFGEVTIRPVSVTDMEGYPPVNDELRTKLQEEAVTLPADLPIPELEARLEDRLKVEYELTDISASVDEQGNAHLTVAPPLGSLSQLVPHNRRAVSITGLIPDGVSRGDRAILKTPSQTISGKVISVSESARTPDMDAERERLNLTDQQGQSRLTVVVHENRVSSLLEANDVRVAIPSQGVRREFEVLSVLREAGNQFQKLTIRKESTFDGRSISLPKIRDEHGIAIVAFRQTGSRQTARKGWEFATDGEITLSAGDELFAVGSQSQLQDFETVITGGTIQ